MLKSVKINLDRVKIVEMRNNNMCINQEEIIQFLACFLPQAAPASRIS